MNWLFNSHLFDFLFSVAMSSTPSLVGRSSRYNLSRHVDKKIGDNYMKHVYGDTFDTSYCFKSGSISSIMHDVQKEHCKAKLQN